MIAGWLLVLPFLNILGNYLLQTIVGMYYLLNLLALFYLKFLLLIVQQFLSPQYD